MRKHVAALLVGALVPVLCAMSCKKKDDEVPPMPSAAPTVPPAPVELVPEAPASASAEPVDAGPDVKKVVGNVASRLVSCCRLIGQNAASNPNPLQKGLMQQAAATCESLAKGGNAAGAENLLRSNGIKCQ